MKLPGSIRCQDKDDKRDQELRDAEEAEPDGMGRDMRPVEAILTAKGPYVVGEVDHGFRSRARGS
jgi:hypothetical protein